MKSKFIFTFLHFIHFYFNFFKSFRTIDPSNPPPFPTFVPNDGEEVPENLYHPDLFVMDNDTIQYPKVEEAKRRTGAKTARVRKK